MIGRCRGCPTGTTTQPWRTRRTSARRQERRGRDRLTRTLDADAELLLPKNTKIFLPTLATRSSSHGMSENAPGRSRAKASSSASGLGASTSCSHTLAQDRFTFGWPDSYVALHAFDMTDPARRRPATDPSGAEPAGQGAAVIGAEHAARPIAASPRTTTTAQAGRRRIEWARRGRHAHAGPGRCGRAGARSGVGAGPDPAITEDRSATSCVGQAWTMPQRRSASR